MSDTTEVLRALKMQNCTLSDISDETGLSFDEVHAALYNLKKRGKIKVVPLRYEITPDGLEALDHTPAGEHGVRRPRDHYIKTRTRAEILQKANDQVAAAMHGAVANSVFNWGRG